METHWKKITNPNYIGAYDFKRNEIRKVKIVSISSEKIYSPDNKLSEAVIAKLENSKPMVLCKTNMKLISKILETPFIENWTEQYISLKVEKVRAFGEWVDALRVTTDLPILEPDYFKWNDAKKALLSQKTTIEFIKKNYIISPENEKLLLQ